MFVNRMDPGCLAPMADVRIRRHGHCLVKPCSIVLSEKRIFGSNRLGQRRLVRVSCFAFFGITR
jgi:hypothetical protein